VQVKEGRIQRVWEGGDAAAVDLGDVALLPGLVNAHTHLEFSDLRTPLAPGALFPDWIRAVIRCRRERRTSVRETIVTGWSECAAAGACAVGEIATADEAWDALSEAGACGVVFREVLGLTEAAIERGLETARRFLGGNGPVGARLVPGLSPHAPYSVAPELLRGLIDLSVQHGVPLAMHLAETREELELLEGERGGLVELLRELGVWRGGLWSEFRRPLDYLRELSRAPRGLVVHGNYLTDVEMDFVAAQPQMSVVYCPRTHAAFGHPPHPWLALRERGARVVLGTDSRASNPDLSLFRELQWLHGRFPQMPVSDLVAMATRDAAEALGLGDRLGRLTPGTLVALTVVTPARPLTPDDWQGLLEVGAHAKSLTQG
jgi:cytosine/adenosine deaminase-related metal-dependent hydrolase